MSLVGYCLHGMLLCESCRDGFRVNVKKETLQSVVDLVERKRVLGQIPSWQEEFVRDLVKELET